MTTSRLTGQSESLLTSCPQCNAVVSLPSIVSVDAQLRCPVCSHRFRLRNFLPESIPQLEVIFDTEDSSADSNANGSGFNDSTPGVNVNPMEKLAVSDVLRKGAKRKTRRHRSSDDHQPAEPPVTRSEPEIKTAGEMAQYQSRNAVRRPATRHRSSRQKALIETIKVGLGAMLALPVAQLIIWWGLGVDPLQFGPTVGKAVPFVVPAALRDSGSPTK